MVVPMVRVRDGTGRRSVLPVALILASRIRLTAKGPNGSSVAERCRKSFSALESCSGCLLRRNVFETSCGVHRLEMKRSGDVDGVRNPFWRRMPRPLGVRVPLSAVAAVGLNGTGVKGKAGGSTSSLARLSVDGVLDIEYSEAGGDGYKPPSSLEPESGLGRWLPL